MINSKFLKQERNRLKNKYNDSNILFQKNDLFETIPHPTPLSYEILKKIYSSQGSLGMAYDKLGFYYNKILWDKLNFIETIFGNIMINKNQEKIIFDSFFKKRINCLLSPYFIYKEREKTFRIKEIEKSYKSEFYKNIAVEIINLPKTLKSGDINGINSFISRFINLYQHTLIINIVFASCLKNLSKKIQNNNINLILSQNIKSIDNEWQKHINGDLSQILNDQSFRLKYDLELYCDEYVRITEDVKRKKFKINLNDLVKNIPFWQKDFYKAEIINLLRFKEMAQNARHLFAYAFNKFRFCLYQISEKINLEDKRDICFLEINEISKK
ncbi:hypothetical protein KJ586_01040, partial [Patescibacteria group bacterium]|nr:hypothetical protein [Patescibacteria group bacterium]